jgi:endo-1,4-beta-xylanase
MMLRCSKILVSVSAAILLALVVVAPCAARGSGGFLRDWVACGPIAGVRLDVPLLPTDFTPYPGLLAAGQVWLPLEARDDGRVDLDTVYPGQTMCTAILATYVQVPADGTYRLRIGSDDSVRLEIDGQVVHNNPARRPWRADEDTVRVTLTHGWHRVAVRVVNYTAEWKVSVRVADEKDVPVDLPHQVEVPQPLEAACRFDDPLPLQERAEVAAHLAAEVSQLENDLQEGVSRIMQAPPGYVTFAEYEGARAQGLRFLRAMAEFWRETGSDNWNLPLVDADRREAVQSARAFSQVMANEAAAIMDAQTGGTRIWDILSGEPLPRRQTAAAVARFQDLLDRSRRLASRVENDQVWSARLENDIRNWRQRDMTVRVVDAEGGPVEGATVEIVQTEHDFLFGCNLFAFGRWEDDRRNRLYEKRFRDLFNLAVVPVYWSAMEKRQSRPDYGPLDAAVAWCRRENIRIEAHPVLWRDTTPRWLDDLSADQVRGTIEAHVRQLIDRYRDTVDYWVVMASPAEPPHVGPLTIDPTDALRWAAEARPTGRLLVAGPSARGLADLARRTQAASVRLDGLVLTVPPEERSWPVGQLYRDLDIISGARLPAHLSEVAVPGRSDDEAEQAETVRHLYTAAFANPRTTSITWWDLSDRFAAGAGPTGLVRADLSPKPAYETLDRLINHLWRTDAAGRTDDGGRIAVRAFFGQYRITVRQGQRRATLDVHLGRDGPNNFRVTLPPGR